MGKGASEGDAIQGSFGHASEGYVSGRAECSYSQTRADVSGSSVVVSLGDDERLRASAEFQTRIE